jgi:ssDNA-binding replication factor A large subunit
MIQGNYDQILKLISDNSGIPVGDIERKIEAKRAKLSGLISKEGAAQIIASELGVNFEKQKMKISELLPGMKRISMLGKIIKINKIVEYNKNGKEGKIGSFVLADETSNIRVVLWDTNHISLFEKKELKEGDIIELNGVDIRNYEVHVSGFGDLKLSNSQMTNVKEEIVTHRKSIDQIRPNDSVSVRGFIVQIFGPNFFNKCPECNKKVSDLNECAEHGKVVPKRGIILNLIADDGTGSIKSVLFSDQVSKIASEEEIRDVDSFIPKRNDLIGKEMIIEGNVRKNKLSENLELFVNSIKEVDLEAVIQELQKSR